MSKNIELLAQLPLPWVEKYRPQTLSDVVSHEELIKPLSNFLDSGQFPHLLLHGPPGTGKTSTIQAIARMLYGKYSKQMVLELNASDDRGIDVVRDVIKLFAETKAHPMQNVQTDDPKKQLFKLIILDEADQMTSAAQMALRRIIEKFAQHVRFAIICNHVNKITPALQSRCAKFRFPPLSSIDIEKRLLDICEQEKVNIDREGIETLIGLSQGDMRKVINSLQSIAMSHQGKIDRKVALENLGFPVPHIVDQIMELLSNSTFEVAFTGIEKIITTKSYHLPDILTCISEKLFVLDLPIEAVCLAFPRLATIEHQLSTGADDMIQLAAIVSVFIEMRNLFSKARITQNSHTKI